MARPRPSPEPSSQRVARQAEPSLRSWLAAPAPIAPWIGMSGPAETGLLAGQRVLVTGGSSGIGRAICVVAAREGARVAFTWNASESGAAATEDMVREHGAACLSLRADLRDRPAADQIVVNMEREWGGVDALVNN